MEKSSFLTAHQLANLLNLSVETIWRYTRNRRIPFVTLGERQYRYNPLSVMEALSESVQESKVQYGGSRQFTYQDYLNLPESVLRTEILDGILVQEPAPLIKHQSVLTHLHILLHTYFSRQDPEGVVFVSPVDVTLSETVVVQPDLLYISSHNREIITETHITGAPDLVIEILSPSSVRKDRFDKYGIYQRFAIPHYWLVDAPGEFIEIYSLNDEGLYVRTGAASTDNFTMPGFPGLVLDMAVLWSKTNLSKVQSDE